MNHHTRRDTTDLRSHRPETETAPDQLNTWRERKRGDRSWKGRGRSNRRRIRRRGNVRTSKE